MKKLFLSIIIILVTITGCEFPYKVEVVPVTPGQLPAYSENTTLPGTREAALVSSRDFLVEVINVGIVDLSRGIESRPAERQSLADLLQYGKVQFEKILTAQIKQSKCEPVSFKYTPPEFSKPNPLETRTATHNIANQELSDRNHLSGNIYSFNLDFSAQIKYPAEATLSSATAELTAGTMTLKQLDSIKVSYNTAL